MESIDESISGSPFRKERGYYPPKLSWVEPVTSPRKCSSIGLVICLILGIIIIMAGIRILMKCRKEEEDRNEKGELKTSYKSGWLLILIGILIGLTGWLNWHLSK